MKRIMQATAIAVLCVALTGCNEPTLDTTNVDTYKKSLEEMRSKITDAQRGQLWRAMERIKNHEGMKLIAEGKSPLEVMMKSEGKAKERMHGMTVDELIEEGEDAEKDRLELAMEYQSHRS